MLDSAQTCIASIDPETEEVETTTFASIADGHEGAAFSMVPGECYATTTVYAVGDNHAEAAFGITGWSYRLLKVR
jgi:hypothetical protein